MAEENKDKANVTPPSMDVIHFTRQKDYIVLNRDFDNGSFGKTIQIQDPDLGIIFIVKKYEPVECIDKERFFESFKREIQLLYKLNHPNIVRVFGSYLYEESHTGFIVMEFIQGVHLDEYLENKRIVKTEIEDVFCQLISAFSYMEKQGIVHRDIRPSNIMVTPSNVAKVIDFGLGKDCVRGSEKYSIRTIVNRESVEKLPEEEANRKYSSQTDLYYLGELFYRLLKENNRLGTFRYRKVLEKMKQPSCTKRFRSFADVSLALVPRLGNSRAIPAKSKKAYQTFVSQVDAFIVKFHEKPTFCYSTTKTIKKLNAVLEVNLFEKYIQKPSQLMFSFFNVGYSFNSRVSLTVDSVKKFYELLVSSTEEMRQLVLRNFEAKLALKPVEAPQKNDLPF